MKATIHYSIIALGFLSTTVELGWRICSSLFFDPLPTALHVLIAYGIPLAILLAKLIMAGEFSPLRNRLALTSLTFALVFSAAYSVWFAPISPLCGIGLIWFGMGGLGLAPFLLFGLSIALFKEWASWLPPEAQHLSHKRIWFSLPLVLPAVAILWWQPLIAAMSNHLLQSDNISTKYLGLGLLNCCVSEKYLEGDGTEGRSFLNLPGMDSDVRKEAYYYIHGSNSRTSRQNEGLFSASFWEFDDNQGTSNVGRKLKNLKLAASTLDIVGRFPQDYAYTEWTMTFANNAMPSAEARAIVELPPFSVVSKASLWIDGEERDAAIGTNAQVKTAYRQVVRTRRDPFLVTVIGPDQVQIQCFPVPENGTMKIRLGITSPLTDGKILTLPHIMESNFNLPQDLRHSLLVEADTPFQSSLSPQSSPVTRHQAELTTSQLSDPSTNLSFEGTPPAEYHLCNNSLIFRRIAPQVTKGQKVVIVADGQQDVLKQLEKLALPQDHIATLVVSHPYDVSIWDGTSDLHEFVSDQPSFGGTNSSLGLVQALDIARRQNAPVLWLYGGLPSEFRDQLRLEQQFRRSFTQSPVVALAMTDQMNSIISDLANLSHFIPARHSGVFPDDFNAAMDLARSTFQLPDSQYLGGRPNSGIEIVQTGETEVSHPYRLYVNSRVMQRYLQTGKVDSALMAETIRCRIVTPVSGAVVLESKSQYDVANLDPTIGTENIPKIPEPGFYILLGMVTVSLLLMAFLKKGAIG